ncbi:MAG: D-2-hydroxyacid dehydrogenase [Anaerolineae bacterium]|nr:D-2-hydroxyacid dehydrogenase [Anaerolineae bacterium]MDW8102795.1 D-2-hydroxyacid dehydrogenase [Anaerolineae bacterium]
MEQIKVLSVLNLSEENLETLRKVSPRLEVNQVTCRNPTEMKPLLEDVEILYTIWFPFDPAEVAPRLKWIQLSTAGVDHLLDSPVMKSQVIITTTSGIHAVPIAEYVFATMLFLVKRLPLALEYQKRREWPSYSNQVLISEELRDKTIGIVGYGSIGREVARLARAFGMTVFATKRHVEINTDKGYRLPGVGDPEGTLVDRLYPNSSLREMISLCDFVVIAAPLTPETYHMIGPEELAAMKPSAYLINIARGAIVDETALVEALRTGKIAGAALDVFEKEPLPPESPLWDLPNVILTPHVSAVTPRYNDRATALFAENLRRYLEGKELLNVVDKTLGY